MKNTFEHYLLPKFGNYKLSDITRDEFQLYVNYLQNVERPNGLVGYSTATIKTIKANLSAVLNDAVYSNHLDVNRIQRIRIK